MSRLCLMFFDLLLAFYIISFTTHKFSCSSINPDSLVTLQGVFISLLEHFTVHKRVLSSIASALSRRWLLLLIFLASLWPYIQLINSSWELILPCFMASSYRCVLVLHLLQVHLNFYIVLLWPHLSSCGQLAENFCYFTSSLCQGLLTHFPLGQGLRCWSF